MHSFIFEFVTNVIYSLFYMLTLNKCKTIVWYLLNKQNNNLITKKSTSTDEKSDIIKPIILDYKNIKDMYSTYKSNDFVQRWICVALLRLII